MSVSVSMVVSTGATIAVPGTSVSPVVAVPDNCHTIILVNDSATDVLYKQGTAGGTLVAPPGPGVIGSVLRTGDTVTLPIGTARDRGSMDVAGKGLIFDSLAAVSVSITYLCKSGLV